MTGEIKKKDVNGTVTKTKLDMEKVRAVALPVRASQPDIKER